ncbi:MULTISPECIES: antibiotic biosynthesis monooxygenase [Streptomyces]|uniref:Antibiotic biosynthesis monooxygenase n=1 Tax=Streptomyces lycii TaxID=2654337 RepID=A0ABQ7FE25_9ACTN|nr:MULTISPECIES: antibiotic biosynthesis monooxygenase [Streptomyces]KAF4407261.1 antibiotic biosynthesis monooxygenase [Streptomyces lycii]PGH50916.1 antibiotic biosynthesis monooxygenase [Streptomyces sp. Ru87]
MPERTVPVLPDVTRPDAGAPMFSTWRVGTPERQRAVADAIADTWDSRPWPTPDLLGYAVYASTDGDTLLHHSQWSDESAYHAFVRNHRQERNDAIDAAVPGIERVGLHTYELYRHTKQPGDRRVPGCIVVVDAVFDGPGPERQRAWVDAVFEALGGEEIPHPGGISGNFFVSTDGTRVLNYAEWESEEAHVRALASPGEGIGSGSAAWQRVQNFPGLRRDAGGVRRYRLAWSGFRR